MSYRSQFTKNEWQTLQFAPLWVFNIIAGIDGNLEKKEVVALAEELSQAFLYKNALAREVFVSVGQNFEEVWPAYRRDSRSALSGLHEVNVLLDQKVDQEDAEGFRRAVITLGVEIIEKSSKQLFGKKDKTKEKAALVLAAIALGVKPE